MKKIITILLFSFAFVANSQNKVYFVSTTGSDSNDGLSWITPIKNLQTALDLAVSGDQIWVAQGTYYPDEGTGQTIDDRTSSFVLKSGVEIYGGFIGVNSTLNPRDIKKYPTILSGDLDQNDGASATGNNSYHVITGADNTVVDGFTITRGLATGTGTNQDIGGGLFNDTASPTISNCIFDGNTAIIGGGAIYNTNSSPTISNTTFSTNNSNAGGAVYNTGSAPDFTNCFFIGNSSPVGGAIYNTNNSVVINAVNCVFSGNLASQKGGAIYNLQTVLTLTNCTVTTNKADIEAGGLYVENSTSVNIQNSIIWNNSANSITNVASATLTETNSTVTFANSLIHNYTPQSQGGTTGILSNGDPLFIKYEDPNTAPTLNGDYRLMANSPALDVGNNSLITETMDVLGNVRVQNTTIDLGAYEGVFKRVHFVSTTGSDTNNGLSWSGAYRNLQTALVNAANGDQIWVQKGTYYPDEGSGQTNDARASNFSLKEGVGIYGGFSGNEAILEERNITHNVTILSGDIDGNDIIGPSGNNAYHVVSASSIHSQETILDGFTITGGLANGSADEEKKGAGITMFDCTVVINRCMINGNEATGNGGGISIESATPTITDSRISENTAAGGGGIFTLFDAAPEITGCIIYDNNAATGAGVYNKEALPRFTNCTIRSNSATGSGGGMANETASPEINNVIMQANTANNGGGIYNTNFASPILINCLLTGNKAVIGGAMDNSSSAGPSLINCTVSGNQSTNDGGGIYNDNATLAVKNTIVWNNSANGVTNTTSASLSDNSGSTTTYTNSLLANFTIQTGIILNSNPLFVTDLDPANAPSALGNFHLQATSVALNVGDNASNTLALDLDGNTRVQATTIDLGVYEGEVILSTWTGAVDTDWMTAGNWSNGIPSSSLSAIIPNTGNQPSIAGTANAEINDLIIDANATLSIISDGTLTIDGNLNNAGTLIANSGSSLIVKGASTGMITYNRTLGTTDFYFVSSPVKGQDIDAFATAHSLENGPNPSDRELNTYNNTTEDWNYYQDGSTNSGVFLQGEGRRVRLTGAGDISFTGEMPVTDIAISMTSSANEYNLIGNPYPSSIPVNTAASQSQDILSLNKNSLTEQTIWMYDKSTGFYIAVNQASPAQHISPAQGFFVSAKPNTTFNFKESMQSHQADNFRSTSMSEPKVVLSLTDGSTTKNTQVIYLSTATTGFDNSLDSSIFELMPSSFNVYTHAVANGFGRKLEIQSLPDSNYENMVIPIGVKASSGSSITFTVDASNIPTGFDVYLEDKNNNSFTQLNLANTDYSTTLTNNLDGIGRFYMHVSDSALSIDDVKAENISMYLSSSDNLRIVGIHNEGLEVRIYNLLGKEVLRDQFVGNGVNDVTLSTLKSGFYIVKMKTKGRSITKKIIK
ncbi:MAG: T9SS type A sorting domain-containing protein [Flavobacteriaceae bacterium]